MVSNPDFGFQIQIKTEFNPDFGLRSGFGIKHNLNLKSGFQTGLNQKIIRTSNHISMSCNKKKRLLSVTQNRQICDLTIAEKTINSFC